MSLLPFASSPLPHRSCTAVLSGNLRLSLRQLALPLPFPFGSMTRWVRTCTLCPRVHLFLRIILMTRKY